ncbi:MAG: thiamine diphosphokinase [Rhodobacteraceae bacterium]|nr:thiamine diphosphokinase [Paracoccaceae bacterium]
MTADGPVTLVGGGPVAAADLDRALGLAPRLVAADGGADRLDALGRSPEAVIGDMDSISHETRARLAPARLHEVAEQDSTDFEKCLTRIAAPLVLALGFTGGRIDHELSVFSVLARHRARRCAVLGAEDAVLLAPPRLALDLAPGTRLSLFPLGEVTGRSRGLFWPIGGLRFHPLDQVGTSNRVTGPVELEFDAPRMLLILPAADLSALLTALARAPHWDPDCDAT